jgi:hypothetical protein
MDFFEGLADPSPPGTPYANDTDEDDDDDTEKDPMDLFEGLADPSPPGTSNFHQLLYHHFHILFRTFNIQND